MEFRTASEAIQHVIDSGRTKYFIAKKIGVSPTMINHYLRGSSMSNRVNVALYSAFQVRVSPKALRDPGSGKRVPKTGHSRVEPAKAELNNVVADLLKEETNDEEVTDELYKNILL